MVVYTQNSYGKDGKIELSDSKFQSLDHELAQMLGTEEDSETCTSDENDSNTQVGSEDGHQFSWEQTIPQPGGRWPYLIELDCLPDDEEISLFVSLMMDILAGRKAEGAQGEPRVVVNLPVYPEEFFKYMADIFFGSCWYYPDLNVILCDPGRMVVYGLSMLVYRVEEDDIKLRVVEDNPNICS
ncbi:hypothetical protein C8J56DRAFT_886197 [Mycena floridula]|nr:hypothetical protein C8J56DRAFT_886197 [Mycena floridula]